MPACAPTTAAVSGLSPVSMATCVTPIRRRAAIAAGAPLRSGAPAAIAALRRIGVTHVAMLTGDNPETAAVVGAQAGIDDVRAGLLPAQKVAAVAELRDRYGAVAMVGDGVNDAPALAAATLGIAMGAAGADAALETADIALMGDDLCTVPDTIRLARRRGRRP